MASTLDDEISRLELLYAAHPDGLVFSRLADAYRRAGRLSQAESVLSRGLTRHPADAGAQLILARLRLDQGRRDEARDAFRAVLQLEENNRAALQYLGEMAAEDGQVEQARQLFRRLEQLNPDGPAQNRVREPRPKASRWEHRPPVRQEGRMAGNGSPGFARRSPEPGEVVTETMAELYARQGLFDRAAAVYQQLLEQTPGDTRLRAKLEQVEHYGSRATESPRRSLRPVGTVERGSSDSTGATRPAGGSPPELRGDRPARGPAAAPAPPEPESSIRDQLGSLLSWSPPASDAQARPAEPSWLAEPPRPSEPSSPAEPSPLAEPPVATGGAASRLPGEAGEPEGTDHLEPAVRQPVPAVPPGAELAAGLGLGMSDGMDRFAGASTQLRTLLALSDLLVGLLEYRDPFFRGSSSLTRLMATSVATDMGLGEEDQANLALAAVLRDLGRLAMGGRLLPAPKFAPSAEGRRKIERHVDLALHLLEGVELPAAVRQAVRHHHERWDGAGYPARLAGDDIPVLARILAVVDSFTAMVSPRPYRLPKKVPDAARELEEESGTRYDPAVVAALLRVIASREQPHLGFVQRHHILLVDPDQPGAVVTGAKLCSAGYLAEVMADAGTARERLRRVPVAALVLSAEAGEAATADFVRDLRTDSAFGSLPIVVVEAEGVELRVRLLESGADVCFPPGITHAELQGTLGALVRRNLRARPEQAPTAGESSWLALQGDIQDFPLTWLLQVMKYDSRTAAIGIRTSSREGAIYLSNGDAVHAEIRKGGKGEPALREMLDWRKGRFTVQPDARPREQTIRTSIMHLLLTQAVEEDHAAAGIFGAVSAGS